MRSRDALPSTADQLSLRASMWLDDLRELAQREPVQATRAITAMLAGLASVAPHDDELAGYLTDEAA